ncbi:MAG: glycogen-binding domain-containing protein [Saprospirales bacterium]|nr:glycogen-binding domain-containing protein [Saprospirales bacterium]
MIRSFFLWLFLGGSLVFVSCGEGGTSEATSSETAQENNLGIASAAQRMDSIPLPLVSGWIPPVQLTGVETEMRMENFFSDPSPNRFCCHPSGHRAQLASDKKALVLTIDGDPALLSTLCIWAGGEPYDLLLKYPTKIHATLRLRDSSYKKVRVKGEMNNWDAQSAEMKLQNGIWEYTFDLEPGDYLYRFEVDGKEILDPKNPQKGNTNSGGTYSKLSLKQANAAKMPKLRTMRTSDQSIELELSNPGAVFAFWENHLIPTRKEGGKITIPIPEEAASRGESFIRVFGQNETGTSNELLIPLQSGRVANDPAGEK